MNAPALRTSLLGFVFAALSLIAAGPGRAFAAASASAADSLGIPHMTFQVLPEHPCASEPVVFRVQSCGSCASRVDFVAPLFGRVHVQVTAWENPLCDGAPCPQDTREVQYPFAGLGSNFVDVRAVIITVHPDSSRDTLRIDRGVNFTVAQECPPPPPTRLPYVDRVVIGTRPAPCDTCPPEVCPEDSIRVRVEGALPGSCWSIRSVEWLPITSPIMLPVLGITIADSTCSPSDSCSHTREPWGVTAFLPPGSPGDYSMFVMVRTASCRGGSAILRDTVYAGFPYRVLESCAPPGGCVESTLGIFDDRVGELPCDVFVGPDGTALATLQIQTHVPLAGIEGIVQSSRELTLLSLEAVGPAAGMHLVVGPSNDAGVRFVLFSDSGAPIPPGTWGILRGRVQLAPPISMNTWIGAVTLASDSLGGEVPVCIHAVAAGRAVGVCRAPRDTCDANGDGLANVRDLVLMARCLRDSTNCPAGGGLRFDCNHDSRFGLADLICCARVILRGGDRDTMPARAVDGVALEMGEPVRDAQGVRIPLRLVGSNQLGAAVLRFDYPADRYELDGVDFANSSEWLQLSDGPSPGRTEIGLVALSASSGAEVPMTVRLRLKTGASHGGLLQVHDCELSAPDGARLTAPLDGAQIELGTGASVGEVSLSAARPNPSGGATRFAVSLPRTANVDLGVFDLAGRRVATLASGRLTAGAREFTWDGRGVRDGMYFARLVVDGRTFASRVTLLRMR